MGWFDDNYTPYEVGGFTGGGGEIAPAHSEPAAPAFDQYAQVGHNDTFNGLNREQWRDKWMSSGATNVNDLKAFLAQNGGRLLSDNGTVITPYGETMDIGTAFRSGHGSAGWGGVGGGEIAVPDGSSFNAALGQSAVAAAQAGGGGGQVGGGNYLPSDFQWEKFDPNSVDVTKDPGYAFRLAEAQKAQELGAAAKGTLLTGAFQKALAGYNQNLASQEYGNAFQRALGVNQANNQGGLSTYNALANAHLGQGNLDLGFTRAGNEYALGLGQLALGNKTADQNYELGKGNLGLGYYRAGNDYSLGQGQLGLGWANYGLNADQQNFNQGAWLAGAGQKAAGDVGLYGSQYGANAGGYMTGAGNASAAGQVGAANAWGNAIGNGVNQGLGYYYASRGY